VAPRRIAVTSGSLSRVVLVDGAQAIVDGATVTAQAVGDGRWLVQTDGGSAAVYVAGTTDAMWAFARGRVYRVEVDEGDAPSRRRTSAGVDGLSAPMPATVRAVLVTPGDRVRAGDTLVVLEAMKMELPVRSPVDGVVGEVRCRAGELVQPGVPLVEVS
jgi:3-methylcrotonyl-CoA carboxylase alpha subunit